MSNKEQINQTLTDICTVFNDTKIDYCLVGALSGYLQSGGEIIREHDDLDFMLNENDIEAVQELLNRHSEFGFSLNDTRAHPCDIVKGIDRRGKLITYNDSHEHDIYALHKSSPFHLGFFAYERTHDGVLQKQFFKDERTGQAVIKARKTKMIDWQRNYTNKIIHNGLKITCNDIHLVLAIKETLIANENRPKDTFDMAHLKSINPYIDPQRIQAERQKRVGAETLIYFADTKEQYK